MSAVLFVFGFGCGVIFLRVLIDHYYTLQRKLPVDLSERGTPEGIQRKANDNTLTSEQGGE